MAIPHPMSNMLVFPSAAPSTAVWKELALVYVVSVVLIHLSKQGSFSYWTHSGKSCWPEAVVPNGLRSPIDSTVRSDSSLLCPG